jgi:hypothetical protein
VAERELLAYVGELVREENAARWQAAEGEEDGGGRVLQSANRLFLKIRKSLQDCVKHVSRGAPLLALAGAFQARCGLWTSLYCVVLLCVARPLCKRRPKIAACACAAPPLQDCAKHVLLGASAASDKGT